MKRIKSDKELKKIVFINQDSGYLMIDIINAHAEKGYNCTLLTGRLVQRNIPLNDSVLLRKITQYYRNSLLVRLYSWFAAFFKIIYLVWFCYPQVHLFIVSNPPFAPLIPLLCKNPYTLIFFDVYIEVPKDAPFLGKILPVVNLWINAHRRVLKKANRIITLTEGMRRSIEKFSAGKSVEVIYEWSDNSNLKPVSPDVNPFLKKHNLNKKFVVMYSGNIGESSCLETLVNVANIVRQSNIVFVIIGDGIKKAEIVKMANNLKLNNCVFLPWQDPSVLPYSLASASVAVVSLSSSASNRSIPSKIYDFLSVGTPILCIADSNADVVSIVQKHRIGECFGHQDITGIARYITNLSINPDQCKLFSRNSLIASELFTPTNALQFVKN